jgi:hypothetical protein
MTPAERAPRCRTDCARCQSTTTHVGQRPARNCRPVLQTGVVPSERGAQPTPRKNVLDGSLPCDWEKNGVNVSPVLDRPS